jgi:secreted trypsin-like serine protease
MIAPGDSGGPLFIGRELAGINSFTMADRGPLNSREGEETGHTRVSLYLEWIAAVQGLTAAR